MKLRIEPVAFPWLWGTICYLFGHRWSGTYATETRNVRRRWCKRCKVMEQSILLQPWVRL